MNMIKSFISVYGFPILSTIITAVISYIGIHLKNTINTYLKHKTKIEEAEMVYHATEELYPNISKEDKYQKMVANLKQILKEKNINITDLEINILLYSVMNKERSQKNEYSNL